MATINLHEGQSEIIRDLFVDKSNRYAVVAASRGFGKSYVAGTAAMLAVQELMDLPASVPNKNVALICPTLDQARDIYYPLIAWEFGMEDYSIKHSHANGTMWFPNNTYLRLWSYEASARLRGTGQYFVVADEVTSWKGAGTDVKEAWESVIQPTLTTRWSPANARRYKAPSPGRALIISTPSGYDYFYELYNRGEINPDWKSYHYDYNSSPYLDPEEIDRLKSELDPIKFAKEYLANFEDSGNTVFYMFKRDTHITNSIPYFEKREDVHCAIDFNVGIQATSFAAIRGGQVHFLDETMGHPNTEKLAEYIYEKFVSKGHKVFAYPDPSGRARKSSAPVGVTDFSILEGKGITIRSRSKAPPLADSVNAVNRKLMNGHGEVDMYIHPKCTNLITSFERTTWMDNNPNSLTIDKKQNVEHFTDGVRYFVEYMWPVRAGSMVVATGNRF